MPDQRTLRLLEAGLEAHRRGDLATAKAAFWRALAIAPSDPDALNLYGTTLLQSGEPDSALEFLQRAVNQRRNNPAYLGNLAHAYFALKRYDEAREAFRKAARLEPGALQFRLGIANSFALQGELTSAEQLLRKLAVRFSKSPLVWFNLGNVLRDTQRAEEAIASFREAIKLDPEQVDARNSLAQLMHKMMRFEDAEREYRECLRIAPDFMVARCNLASVVMDLGRFDEAAALCRDIIRAAPEQPLGHSFLGAVLSHQGRLLDALASTGIAAHLSPDDAKIAQTYAATLSDSGRFSESLPWFARALALNPQLNSTHQLLAHALLGHGCFAEGWEEYIYRPWPTVFLGEHPNIKLTNTLPQDSKARHIYVVGEQGLGDELFFLRFAPLLHAAGARISYCANPKIQSLLSRSSALDQVLDSLSPPPDASDIILVGDLPHAVSSSPATAFPSPVLEPSAPLARWPARIACFWPLPPPPLQLTPRRERIAEMQARLAAAGPGPYIGLTWRSGTPPREQRAVIWVLYKEVGIEGFTRALRETAGTFIAVQRKPQYGEVDLVANALGKPVHDFSALNEDLEGMLALLYLLDDYIGVSNTNTHLRASLGKSARVLVPSPPDWRWMMNHSKTSPWFPGFSIYRQSVQGDWQAALDQLRRDLGTR